MQWFIKWLRTGSGWFCLIVWGLTIAHLIKETVPELVHFVSSGLAVILLYIIAFGAKTFHGPKFIEQTTEPVFQFFRERFQEATLGQLLSLNILSLIFFLGYFDKFKIWFKESAPK